VSSIFVRAPATSANLGAGFDCLGLALDLWNEVSATPGRLAADDDSNLILRAARAVYDTVG
jgi:homoserine kinase